MNSIHVTVLSAMLVAFLSGCVPSSFQINPSNSQLNQSSGSESVGTSQYQRPTMDYFVDRDEAGVRGFLGKVTIPIEVTDSGNIYIVAKINGILPVRFQLDTGATSILISKKTWEELLSKGGQTETEFFSARPNLGTVATGEVVGSTLFLLDSLEVDSLEVGGGKIKLFKVRASRFDKEDGVNLLGMSFLKELGEFTIDVENKELIARPSDNHRWTPRGDYFDATDQRMMTAIQHWDTIAKQEAEHISNKLNGNESPIFIEVSPTSQFTDDQASIPFQQVYPDLLRKHLLDMGWSVIPSIDQQGELSPFTLKSKIMVGGHSEHWDELVVTTEISNQLEIVFSGSNIFYLPSERADNYGPVTKWKEALPTLNVVNCNSGADC